MILQVIYFYIQLVVILLNDIKLLINDEEFDIREWLESFRENYFKYIKYKAQDLLAERLSEKVDVISNELENLRSKIIEVETSIDLN